MAGWPPEDFDEAYEALMPRALAVAERILGEGPDAEDAACEALVRALADRPRVRRLPYRDGWVLRVAANVAVDAARRRLVRLRPQPDLLVPFIDTEEVTTQRLALAAELQALSRRQREVLVLRHMAGLSEADVAKALGISAESAKTHLKRGRARLEARLRTSAHIEGTWWYATR
ncbi:MAG: hypothetical protein QOF60_189 [Actinomycetota bacterium]|nr:hypothetical protein [Actinomycetota bacterium]